MNDDYQSYKEYKNRSSGTVKKSSTSRTENEKGKLKDKRERPKTKPLARSEKREKPDKRMVVDKRKSSGRSKAVNHKASIEKKRIIEERKKEISEKKKIEKQEKRAQRWHAVKSNKKIFLAACFVVFYIGISMGILYNNSNIAELQYKINALNKDIVKENNLLNELEAERESTYKSETIENYAKYRLNMVYPTKEQIVYIKID